MTLLAIDQDLDERRRVIILVPQLADGVDPLGARDMAALDEHDARLADVQQPAERQSLRGGVQDLDLLARRDVVRRDEAAVYRG